MVTPPMTEQRVSECRVPPERRRKGRCLAGGRDRDLVGNGCALLARPAEVRSEGVQRQAIDLLTRSLPTSPMSIAFVVGSMENRQGFRGPYATISGLAPATDTNGFPGMPCRRSPGDRFGFSRSLRSSVAATSRFSTPNPTWPVGTVGREASCPHREQDGNGRSGRSGCSGGSRDPGQEQQHEDSACDAASGARQTGTTLQHQQQDYGDRRAMDLIDTPDCATTRPLPTAATSASKSRSVWSA